MQDEVAAVVPAAVADDLVGHARRSTSAPGSAPSSSAPASTVVDLSALHARVARPHSYRRDGAARRPPGRRDLDARPMSRARDELAAGLDAVRAPDRRRPAPTPAATPTRSRWSWSPSSSRPPTSGSSPTSASPTSGRTATRRPRPRPPSAPTSTCAGTSSAACRATRRPRSRRTPTSSSRSTGAKLVGAARPRARTSAATPVDVLLQVSLDPPGRRGPRRAPTPTTCADLAAAVEEAGMLRLRGLMAVAPLGEDPAAAFARLADDPRRLRRATTRTPPGSRPG